MSAMREMRPMSLVAAVAPCKGKIIRNSLTVLKEKKVCYKMAYYTLYKLSQSPEIVLQKLESTQTKN